MPDLPPAPESPPVPPPPVPPPPPPPDPDPTPTESSSAVLGGVGTVEVTVLVDGSPAPPCHIRVAADPYDGVGLFVDPTANPLVFTDVPATADGLLQTYCYPTLYPGCTAGWTATWPGGSFGGALPSDGSPFGPLTVVEGETTVVVIEITCGAGSGSSTSLTPDCCPPVWWCLDGGGYDSSPVGPRPDGVVGRPKRSEAKAAAECPPLVPPPVAPLALDCYAAGYTVPGAVTLTVANVTGAPAFAANWPYSGTATVYEGAGGVPYYDDDPGCLALGCGASASWPASYPLLFQVSAGGNFLAGILVVLYLGPRPDGSGVDVTVYVGLVVDNTNTCGLGGLTFAGDNGFSDFDSLEKAPGEEFCGIGSCGDHTRKFFPGTTLAFGAPVRVGRVTGHSIGGAYDYYDGLEFDIYLQ